MRLARNILAAACLLAGGWLLLRTLGLLSRAETEAGHWWPAIPLALGTVILIRSLKPGPQVAAAAGLMLAGGAAFATTHRLIAGRYWTLAGAAGLIAAGALWTWANRVSGARHARSPTPTIVVLFRAAEFTPATPDLERIEVFLFCGRLDLHLEDAVRPGDDRDTVMIDITSWAGRVKITVAADVPTYSNDAFVKRFRSPVRTRIFDDDQTDMADVTVSTLALFGGTEVMAATTPRDLSPQSSNALPGPSRRPPATQ